MNEEIDELKDKIISDCDDFLDLLQATILPDPEEHPPVEPDVLTVELQQELTGMIYEIFEDMLELRRRKFLADILAINKKVKV